MYWSVCHPKIIWFIHLPRAPNAWDWQRLNLYPCSLLKASAGKKSLICTDGIIGISQSTTKPMVSPNICFVIGMFTLHTWVKPWSSDSHLILLRNSTVASSTILLGLNCWR
ncbi:hypothetical protein O6H91_17G006700 [Diphasiastrum complanatum]|uniref:Uncharacterized protein n=1 Tax=Diphasiastrum complanatum TaxID=34168 RepID=A0ACC2B408_DIPCM|nr:hypothetical protein O6H91_17G006700 [Diphasiastrum complanatum]